MRTSRTPMARVAVAVRRPARPGRLQRRRRADDHERARAEPDQGRQADGLHVLPYEPFEFEKDGEVVGFDIELVKEVAEALDVEVAYVNEDFEDDRVGRAAQRRQLRRRCRRASRSTATGRASSTSPAPTSTPPR